MCHHIFAHYLDMPRDSHCIYFHVSIPVVDSIVVDHVYRSRVVTIWVYEPRVDRVLPNMVDF